MKYNIAFECVRQNTYFKVYPKQEPSDFSFDYNQESVRNEVRGNKKYCDDKLRKQVIIHAEERKEKVKDTLSTMIELRLYMKNTEGIKLSEVYY